MRISYQVTNLHPFAEGGEVEEILDLKTVNLKLENRKKN